MRSSSRELISVYRAPNLHIDNAKMSKVTAPRLHLNLQKPDFFDRVSFAKHCDFAFIRIKLNYQKNNLHLETKSTRTYGNLNK